MTTNGEGDARVKPRWLRTAQALALGVVTAWSVQSCRFPEDAFHCTTSEQCTSELGGLCEDTGRCTYPDGECKSGRRYGHYSGGNGVCTDSGEDAGPDGTGSTPGSGGASGSGGKNGGSGGTGAGGGSGTGATGNGGGGTANTGGANGTGSTPGQDIDGGPLPPDGNRLTVTAGAIGGEGSIDGKGTLARFGGPGCIAWDKKRYIYIGEELNDTIRRFDTQTQEVTTIAGDLHQNVYKEGTGKDAHFFTPECLTYDEDSGTPFLFIAEFDGHRVRQLNLTNNQVTLVAGSTDDTDGHVNAVGADARFGDLAGVTRGNGDDLYVADFGNHAIRAINLKTKAVTTIAGALDGTTGTKDGAAADALFNKPFALAFDHTGNKLYISEAENEQVRMLDVATKMVSTVVPATGAIGALYFDATSNKLYATAGDRGKILLLNPAQKNFSVVLPGVDPNVDADGSPSQASFAHPYGITVTSPTTIYVADSTGNTLRKLQAETAGGAYQTTTVSGVAGFSGNTDATGPSARFDDPNGLQLDPDGHTLYVADRMNGAIRTVDLSTSKVSTFAGGTDRFTMADGIGREAKFAYPSTVTLGPSVGGKRPLLYVAEDKGVIRQVDLDTAQVTHLNEPITDAPVAYGLAVTDKMIYGTAFWQRQIASLPITGGVASVFLGDGNKACDDATFDTARFGTPAGLLWDGKTTLYLADSECQGIFKIDLTAKTVKLIAGGWDESDTDSDHDGIGKAARFKYPGPIAWNKDKSGIYIADFFLLRHLDLASLKVTTIIGDWDAGGGTWLFPNPARLGYPDGLATTADGSLFIATDNAILRFGKP